MLNIRDFIYGGIIIAILAAFGWYTLHERAIGEQKIEAADARAVTIQKQHNADVTAAATAASNKAVEDYHEALAAVDVPAPSIVCHAANRSAVPSHAAATVRSDGATAVPEESTVPFDPAPAILDNDKQADAQVALLQAYVTECQRVGLCRTK